MPFINFSTGLVLQNNGTNVAAGVLDFSGTDLTVSEGVATFSAPGLTVTDGAATTISNVTTLTATNLDLAGTLLAPVLVQSAGFANGGIMQLSNSVIPGNYVVWFGLLADSDPTPPAPFQKLEDGGFGVRDGYLCGGYATQTTSPQINLGVDGFGMIYEFSGVTGVQHNTLQLNGAIPSPAVTLPALNTKSCILHQWASAFNGVTSISALEPSGTVQDLIDTVPSVNTGALNLRTPTATGTPTIGFTNGASGSSAAIFCRWIALNGGYLPGNASING